MILLWLRLTQHLEKHRTRIALYVDVFVTTWLYCGYSVVVFRESGPQTSTLEEVVAYSQLRFCSAGVSFVQGHHEGFLGKTLNSHNTSLF